MPAPWKNAVVKQMLKKSGIDPIQKNYRPMSNLPFVVEIAEKAAIDSYKWNTGPGCSKAD